MAIRLPSGNMLSTVTLFAAQSPGQRNQDADQAGTQEHQWQRLPAQPAADSSQHLGIARRRDRPAF